MDATRIFRGFYGKHNKACSENCRFFTKDNKKIKLDLLGALRMQGRILNHLYSIGWRWVRPAPYNVLNKEIAKYGHMACSPEPLSDNDRFPITKIIVIKDK